MEWFRVEWTASRELRLVRAGEDKDSIAVSYTWGPPPYNVYSFELHDESGCTSKGGAATKLLKLGPVWSLSRFLEGLWAATQGRAFWLDQFSLPQDRTLRRQLLTEIPRIYKTHLVRVIVDVTPCNHHTKWSAIDTLDKDGILGAVNEYFDYHLFECAECIRLLPWLTRLWPRQESYYAKDLQLVYISSKRPFSMPSDDPFLKVLEEEDPDLTNTSVVITRSLAALVDDKSGVPGLNTTDENAKSAVNARQIVARRRLFHLLRGDVVMFSDDIDKVDFDYSLARLAQSNKKATDPKDLVLAVWCDLPGYKVPDAVESMPLADLLDDACQQYRRLRGREPPVLLTRGIAGQAERSTEPFILRAAPDVRDSIVCYAQWRIPYTGTPLHRRGRLTGVVDLNFLSVISCADFHHRYPTLRDLHAVFRRHASRELMVSNYAEIFENLKARWPGTDPRIGTPSLRYALMILHPGFDQLSTDEIPLPPSADVEDALGMITLFLMGLSPDPASQYRSLACFAEVSAGFWMPALSRHSPDQVNRLRLMYCKDAWTAAFIVIEEETICRIVGRVPQIPLFRGPHFEYPCY